MRKSTHLSSPMTASTCGIGILCVVLQREKHSSRMSQNVGMQADSNAASSAKSRRFCTGGFMIVGRKSRQNRAYTRWFKGLSRSFAWTILASSSSNSSTRTPLTFADPDHCAMLSTFCCGSVSDFYHSASVPRKNFLRSIARTIAWLEFSTRVIKCNFVTFNILVYF